MHSPRDVPLGVLKKDQAAHGRNGHFLHDHFATVRHYGFRDRVHIFHRDAAFESGHSLPLNQFAPPLQRTLYPWIFLTPGLDQKETRWSPGLELPSEDLFIKLAGPCDIVRVDRKMSNVISHL